MKEQHWIEAPEGWGQEDKQEENSTEHSGGMLDIFERSDPSESFSFDIELSNGVTKSILLSGFRLDSDETDRSTGVTIWKAAPRLVRYLQEHISHVSQKSVLELGAGLGLVGIATWHLGAKRTVMTDADTHTLQKMRENVLKNCNVDDATNHNNTLECKQLIWGSPHMEKFKNEHGVYDTILAADVIYTNSSIEPLFDTVACLLKPNGIFVLSRYNKWFGIEDAGHRSSQKEAFTLFPTTIRRHFDF